MPQTPNPSSLECPAPPIASRVVKLQASKDNAGVCVQEMLFSNRTTAEQLVYCGSHPVLDFFSEPEIILNVEISGAHDGTYVNQTIEVGHITYGELAFEAASAVYMAVEANKRHKALHTDLPHASIDYSKLYVASIRHAGAHYYRVEAYLT